MNAWRVGRRRRSIADLIEVSWKLLKRIARNGSSQRWYSQKHNRNTKPSSPQIVKIAQMIPIISLSIMHCDPYRHLWLTSWIRPLISILSWKRQPKTTILRRLRLETSKTVKSNLQRPKKTKWALWERLSDSWHWLSNRKRPILLQKNSINSSLPRERLKRMLRLASYWKIVPLLLINLHLRANSWFWETLKRANIPCPKTFQQSRRWTPKK